MPEPKSTIGRAQLQQRLTAADADRFRRAADFRRRVDAQQTAEPRQEPGEDTPLARAIERLIAQSARERAAAAPIAGQ